MRLKFLDAVMLSVLLCLFRFPIAAMVDWLHPRFFIALPMVISLLYCVLSKKGVHSLGSITVFGKFLVGIYLLSIISSSIFFFIDFQAAKEGAAPFLLSTVLAAGFYFFFNFQLKSKNDWINWFDRISSGVIIGGGIIFIISSLVLRTGGGTNANDYYIAPELVSFFLYPSLPSHLSQRTLGFLISLESSGVAILSCTLFKISKFALLGRGKNVPSVLMILFGIVSTLLSTSLTLSLGLFSGIVLVFFLMNIKTQVKVLVGTAFGAFVSLVVLVNYFLQGEYSIASRALIYFVNPKLLGEFWIFTGPKNWSELLFNLEFFKGVPSQMILGVFNVVFVRLEGFGIFPTFIWYALLILPFLLLIRLKSFDEHQKVALLAFYGFAFGALHYSGAEVWGNNYLVFSIVSALSHKYFFKTKRAQD